MAKIVDYQRKKVYAWELGTDLYGDTPRLSKFSTLEEATEFMHKVLRDFGVLRDVKLTYIRGLNRGTAYGDREIKIGDQYKSPRYLLHEIAHIILHNRFPFGDMTGNEHRHGPQFTNMLVELRARYCGDNREELLGAAYKHRIIVEQDVELAALLALKQEAHAVGDKDLAKKVRRQIRALNAKNLKEAAGTELRERQPVVRQKRQYDVACQECGKKWLRWPRSERCSKCGSTDLDWIS